MDLDCKQRDFVISSLAHKCSCDVSVHVDAKGYQIRYSYLQSRNDAKDYAGYDNLKGFNNKIKKSKTILIYGEQVGICGTAANSTAQIIAIK